MKTILTGLPMYGYWPESVFMYVREIQDIKKDKKTKRFIYKYNIVKNNFCTKDVKADLLMLWR